MADDKFTCEVCGGEFDKDPPGRAEAEFAENYPGHDINDTGLACDDCYAKIQSSHGPKPPVEIDGRLYDVVSHGNRDGQEIIVLRPREGGATVRAPAHLNADNRGPFPTSEPEYWSHTIGKPPPGPTPGQKWVYSSVAALGQLFVHDFNKPGPVLRHVPFLPKNAVYRNQPCPCGSGKKAKRCCKGR